MSKEVIAALVKKDADFLEKFVRKILKLSIDYRAKETNEAYAKGDSATAEYNEAFNQWHRLRLNALFVEDEISAQRDRLNDGLSDHTPEEIDL